MKTELQAIDASILSGAEAKQQVAVIQDLMRSVMREGEHYGTIPGCPKPSLYQSGADKIMLAFKLHAQPSTERLVEEDGSIVYKARVKIIHTPSGMIVGEGEGESNSNEEKNKWRASLCDEEYDLTADSERRIKFKRAYGKVIQVKQVRCDPNDLANTLLQMAVKRAKVSAVKGCTATSDIFTQDVEDLPQEYLNQETNGSTTTSYVMTEFTPPLMGDNGKPKRGEKIKFYRWSFQSGEQEIKATDFNLPTTKDGLQWSAEEMEAMVGCDVVPTFATVMSKGRKFVNLKMLELAETPKEQEPDTHAQDESDTEDVATIEG